MKKILLSFILLIFVISARAQSLNTCTTCFFHPGWYVGANVGANVFVGEGNVPTSTSVATDFSLGHNGGLYEGIQLGYDFTPIIGLRGLQSNMTHHWADVSILNPDGSYRLNSFSSSNLTMDLMVNLSNLSWGYDFDRKVDLYLFAGLGVTYRQLSEFSSPLVAGIVRGGVQANYKLLPKLELNLMLDVNAVDDKFNDFVSGIPFDMYTALSVGVTYKFGTSWKSVPAAKQ